MVIGNAYPVKGLAHEIHGVHDIAVYTVGIVPLPECKGKAYYYQQIHQSVVRSLYCGIYEVCRKYEKKYGENYTFRVNEFLLE